MKKKIEEAICGLAITAGAIAFWGYLGYEFARAYFADL